MQETALRPKWVSNNIGGDHQNPVGYLASHGISQEQFAHDLAYGISAPEEQRLATPDQILEPGSTIKIEEYIRGVRLTQLTM
ncbi:hypothetical protein LSI01_04420 [Furfurilactobacillus siliginis]|uniref:Uncharacterized protein n=1 Tax=Furfurilactobacillus siliginis TaxID=348151 RepID=A0A510VQ16_9LACO|nr:hypothetical protein LSI01_04420 [Furfurilactobacillus siliginis]